MKLPSLLAAAGALALAAGCSSDKCPTETPKIQAVASCTAAPGQTFTYRVQLCPTCNLGAVTCDVNMAGATATGGQIFLDPKAEACSSSSSCPSPSCANDASCSVTAPSVTGPVTYTVYAYDPSSNGYKQGALTVDPTATGAACTFL